MNRTHESMAIWQTVTPFNSQRPTVVRPLVGQVPQELPCIGNELDQLQSRMKTVMDKTGDPSTG